MVLIADSLSIISRQEERNITPGCGPGRRLGSHARETGLAYEQFFSVDVQTVGISGFAGHAVFVTTAQLGPGSGRAATGNTQANGHGCVSIKLYLLKLAG